MTFKCPTNFYLHAVISFHSSNEVSRNLPAAYVKWFWKNYRIWSLALSLRLQFWNEGHLNCYKHNYCAPVCTCSNPGDMIETNLWSLGFACWRYWFLEKVVTVLSFCRLQWFHIQWLFPNLSMKFDHFWFIEWTCWVQFTNVKTLASQKYF